MGGGYFLSLSCARDDGGDLVPMAGARIAMESAVSLSSTPLAQIFAALRDIDLRAVHLHQPVARPHLEGAELEGLGAVADQQQFAAGVEGVGPGVGRADGELGAGAAVDQQGAVGDAGGLGVGDRHDRLFRRAVGGGGGPGVGGGRAGAEQSGEGGGDRRAGAAAEGLRHVGGVPV